MRSLLAPVLTLLLIVTAGCSALPTVTPPQPLPAPVTVAAPPEALAADAIHTGVRLLEAPGFNWVGSPQPVLAQQMTYAEALQRIMVAEPQYDKWPPDTRVWLVIFRGQWDLMPLGAPGATLTPIRYDGCLLVLFTARDAVRMAAGDAVCPAG